MPEKILFERKKEYPTEGRLLVDELLGQFGLSVKELQKLSREQRKEIMDQVREILKQEEVIEVLKNKKTAGLSVEDAQLIRQAIGGEKWHKLNELVSYIKTLLSVKNPHEREEIFRKHLAFGVDANEIKHTLTRVYDVMPARIDTDIRHQSSQFYRAVVEVVSNAIDASLKDRSPIGRFGIGFYQILNHLSGPDDRVIVTTKAAKEDQGIRIEFRNRNGNIDFKVSQDNTIREHGTIVELRSQEFKKEEAEEIVKEFFSYTQDAELSINGTNLERWKPEVSTTDKKEIPHISMEIEDGRLLVTDNGIGMNPRVLFEKLLVPKLSEKPPVYELKEKGQLAPKLYYESSKGNERGDIIIQVGGIVIEKERARGINMAKTLVIDLPPSTILGEQRDEVEIDINTVEAMKRVIDQAVALPRPTCFQVINALSAGCRSFQGRSRLFQEKDNLFLYLQKRVKENFPDVYFLPNKKDFLALELEKNVVLLDPFVAQSHPHGTPGLKEVQNWVSPQNVPLFEAKFKSDTLNPLIATNHYLIIDQRVKTGENHALVNRALELAAGWGRGRLMEGVSSAKKIKEQENKEYSNLESLITEHWEALYFGSKEVALRQTKFLEGKRPDITKTFAENIFNRLPSSGWMEAWDLMQWYILIDHSSPEVQLEEILQLGNNIAVLTNNPALNKAINTHNIPLFSAFEKYRADLPTHLKARLDSLEQETEIDGKMFYSFGTTYYSRAGYGSDQKYSTLLSEQGERVQIGGPNNLVYRDKDYEIFTDKIINQQTKEEVQVVLPLKFPWGEIKKEKGYDYNNEKYVFSPNKDIEWIKPAGPDAEYNEAKREPNYLVTDKKGNEYELNFGRLFKNGEEVKSFGHEGVGLKEVLITESGKVLVLGSNTFTERGYDILTYGRRYLGEGDTKEKFYIYDTQGNVVWEYKDGDWGEKLYMDTFDTKDRERRESFWNQLENMAARCAPLPLTGTVKDSDPIVKIYKWYKVNDRRVRSVVGYIDAEGNRVDINNTDKINAATLEGKYTWEGGCSCCGIDTPMHKGIDGYSPYKTEMINGEYVQQKESKAIPHLQYLPVNILSDFYYDSQSKEWLALANNKSSFEKRLYVVAVFDEKGNYLRSEDVGKHQIPRDAFTYEYFDYRDRAGHLLNRLPGELKAIKTDERSGPVNYEGELRSLIKLKGSQVFLNKKSGYETKLAMQEVNALHTYYLNKDLGELSNNHAEAISDFISHFSVPDREKLERLFYRVFEYRNLSAEEMKMLLPVFYEIPDLRPELLENECVKALKKVSYLDPERFIQLAKMVHKSLPADPLQREILINKAIKFYGEKLQGEPADTIDEIIHKLEEIDTYSNSIECDGFTLIKYGIKVPQSEISRSLRPYLIFMQREERELATKVPEAITIPEAPVVSLKLSEVIQWKRLKEKEAASLDYATEAESLGKIVQTAVEGKSHEHIVREITHAIHFQALNSSDLYIRELIQNSVDAMKASGLEEEKRKIKIDVITSGEKEIITQFSDPVGMDINAVINYFLVPGATTKLDKQYIGFYGQGVYTLFKNSREVHVKTSSGNGKTWYLKIKPVIEHEMVTDVEIEFRSVKEEFQGTLVTKIQDVENPFVEGAYIRDSVMTLASGLSKERGEIVFQGEPVNTGYKILASALIPKLGDLTVYRNPNNIVSHHGLFVEDLTDEYTGLVPWFMSRALKEWGGITIDLPKGVELTRSRQGIANKDKISEIINPFIQRTLVKAYLESFRERISSGNKSFPFDKLPYDYFVNRVYDISTQMKADAEKLLQGEPIEDVDQYTTESNVIKLLSLLPIFKVADKIMSLNEIREAYLNKTFPFDQERWNDLLPDTIVHALQKQIEQFDRSPEERRREQETAIDDDSLDGIISRATDELKDWVKDNRENLDLVDKITKKFIEILDPIFRGDKVSANSGFYYQQNYSIAHASRLFRGIAWNLHIMKQKNWGSPLEKIADFKSDKEKVFRLISVLETLAHEFAHTLEEMDDWTHDEEHNLEQARILLQLSIQDGMGKIEEVFK